MAPPFIVKNPTYQELFPIKWVQKNIVEACPFDGDKKHELEYRRQVNLFFWHVLQLSLYTPLKSSDRDKPFGEVWVPLPYSLGAKELPMVFGVKSPNGGPVSPKFERTAKHFSRAHEWLMDNVFEMKKHIFNVGKKGVCRKYKIRRHILDSMYPHKPKYSQEILELTRLYSPLRSVNQTRYGQTIQDMLAAAVNREFKPPRHDLKVLSLNTDRLARTLYMGVLKKLAPNEILLEPVLEYLEQKSFMKSRKALGQFQHVFASLIAILSGPVQIVNESPLTIRYVPSYRLAKIGGRLFEIGGGFQSFPSTVKQRCSVIGSNWDMASSQLNILKEELAKHQIPCTFLENVQSVNDIAERIDLDKKATKICFYATIFSLGELGKSYKSRVLRELNKQWPLPKVYDFISKWNNDAISLFTALHSLATIYETKIRETKHGEKTLKCATGARYDLKKLRVTEARKRKILSHIFSGIESMRLFKVILDDKQVKLVYSLEHDGALLETVGETIHSDDAKFIRKKFSDELFIGDA